MKILVTGAAGFIGSHITEALLKLPNVTLVRIFDNLSTGDIFNLKSFINNEKIQIFIKKDMDVLEDCMEACVGIDVICHQAAIGSVPRSIANPMESFSNNLSGMVKLLQAAKANGVKRIVYASSSSVYGSDVPHHLQENEELNPLSPYAASKLGSEVYANMFHRCYGIDTIGLRYFNVYGPRQNPKGAYAAVIPEFIKRLNLGLQPIINGDGKISRDFTYVADVVNANIKAIFTDDKTALNRAYNIAGGSSTSLNKLADLIWSNMKTTESSNPEYREERNGDVKHNMASLTLANDYLGWKPRYKVEIGLKLTCQWFKSNAHTFII